MFPAAIAYLCIPLFIFLFSFLNMWLTALLAILLVALICCVWHTQKQQATSLPQPLYRYWPILVIVAVFVYGGIWSPFNYWDWQKHFAVFNLLIDHNWPPHIELAGQEYFLRYGLGWYLVPALMASVIGFVALTPTMFMWSLFGICLALLLVLREMRKWWHLLLAALVFFCFSGLDLVAPWFTKDLSHTQPDPQWLQWWAGWGQIAPNSFGVTWVPHHAVPAWLGVCLVLGERRLAVQYGAVLLAAVSLWSPFAAIGVAPFYLWALCKEGLRTALTLPNLVLAPFLLAPLLLYFSSDAGKIPYALATSEASITSLITFIMLEFGVATLLILLCSWRTHRTLLLTTFLSLLALSLTRFGVHNDLLMRGSIASVSVLSLLASQVLMNNGRYQEVIYGKTLLTIYLIFVATVPIVAFISGVDPRQSRISKQHRFTEESYLASDPYRNQYLAKPSARTRLYLRTKH